MLTMNVNGIRAAHRKGLAATLSALEPDVVCLQEVRADLDQIPELGLGHAALWLPADRKGYSGVGTLTRDAPLATSTGIGSQEFARQRPEKPELQTIGGEPGQEATVA